MSNGHTVDHALEGRLPVLPAERIYRRYPSFLWTSAAFGCGIWVFLVGSALPMFGDTRLAVIGYAVGLVLGFVPVMLAAGVVPFRYGVDTMDAAKTAWGSSGASLILIGVLSVSLGWATVIMAMIARGGATLVARSAQGADAEPNQILIIVLAALAIVLCWLLVSYGPRLIERVNNVVGPGLVIVAGVALTLLLDHVGAYELWHTNIDPAEALTADRLEAFAYPLEFGIATSLAWWPYLGGLTRMVAFRRHVMGPSQVGCSIIGGAFSAGVAALAATAFGTADPVVWILELGGPVAGTLVVAAILIGNIAVMGLLVYFAAIAVQQIPWLARLPWRGLLAVLLIPSAVAAFYTAWVLDHVLMLTTYIGMLFVGVTGIGLADYFLLRRQSIDPVQLFVRSRHGAYWYWGGVNWIAVVVCALAMVAYFQIYDPFTLRASAIFRYAGAALPVMAGSCVVYYLTMRLIAERAGKGGLAAAVDNRALPEVGL